MVTLAESTLITFYVIFGVCWLVLTPLSLYYAYKFWRLHKQNIPYFSKRHPKFVVITIISINMYPTIIRPIIDLSGHYLNFATESHILYIILSNLIHAEMMVVSIRIWLLFYDYKHSMAALKLKWKQLIIKDLNNDSYAWPIKYKWSGNVWILSIISFVFLAIEMTIILLSNTTKMNPYQLMQTLKMIYT